VQAIAAAKQDTSVRRAGTGVAGVDGRRALVGLMLPASRRVRSFS
jgi:hypothetical protein